MVTATLLRSLLDNIVKTQMLSNFHDYVNTSGSSILCGYFKIQLEYLQRAINIFYEYSDHFKSRRDTNFLESL